MVVSSHFKKTVTVSLLLHGILLGVLSFSFSKKVPLLTPADVSFLGQCLLRSQIDQRGVFGSAIEKPITVNEDAFVFPLQQPLSNMRSDYVKGQMQYHVKPAYELGKVEAKELFAQPVVPIQIPRRPQEPALILYPVLPYSFTLYFQDRQVAHVELMFKIVSVGLRNSVIIKRKISSGNLDADLVSMRYVSHYLFMQQEKIAPNIWHTVKIDLSAKEQ